MTIARSKFDRNKFFINHRRSLRAYFVYDMEESERRDRELFYAEAPLRWFGRRNITVYDDESKHDPALFVIQDNYWEVFRRNYIVKAANGEVVGKLSKNKVTGLFRQHWDIADAAGMPIGRARESTASMFEAIKTYFHFMRRDDAGNEKEIGALERLVDFFDKWVLNLSADRKRSLDRRVALAVSILLAEHR